MPITNRAKSAVNTVAQNQTVPITKQRATMTARGQLINDSPYGGRTVDKNQPNAFLGMVQSVNNSIPVVGRSTTAAGSGMGGTTAAVSRGASVISGAISKIGRTITGENSSRDNPVSAIQQVSANISGVSKFTNPGSIIASGAGSVSALGGMGTNIQNPLTALQMMGGGGQLIDILLSHGKKTQNAEIKYRIILQFEGNDKTKYDDVLFFTIQRFGFVKSCPMVVTHVNLPPVLIAQLKQQESMNKHTMVNVKIYQVDTENKNKLKNLVIERNYEVNRIKEKSDPSIEKNQTTTCELVLYNPTLVKMDQQYTFNKIENTKTPYEVLQDFESHITSTYGDNFESKHILGKKNEFKYEQIVTQPSDQKINLPNRAEFKFMCKHDSDVPLYLNYKYKIDNSLSFYFFDDFDLKSKKEISRVFIALYDKNKFEKFKVSNQQDIAKQSQITATYAFRDVSGLLTPGESTSTYKLINGEFKNDKQQSASSIKSNTQVPGQGSTAGGDPSRTYNVQKTTETQHQIPTKKTQSINQVPDSDSGNSERNDAAHKVFSEKISQVDAFTTRNCGFDFLRFGVLYAFNEKRPNEYLHTPIAISNIFKRENDKETVLGHTAKFLAVKFSAESSSEGSSQSKSSNSGTNTSRDATKAAVQAKANPENTPTKNQTPLSKGAASPKVEAAAPKPPAGSSAEKRPEAPKTGGPISNKPSESPQTRAFDKGYFRDDGGGD